MRRQANIKRGDTLVYPNHGIMVVEEIGEVPDMGPGIFCHLKSAATGSSFFVPVTSYERAGLRPLETKKAVAALLKFLAEPASATLPLVDRRYRMNTEKLKSGSLQVAGEVLKDLTKVSMRTEALSYREKQMREHVRALCISEVSAVCEIPVAEAEALVVAALNKGIPGSAARRIRVTVSASALQVSPGDDASEVASFVRSHRLLV